MNITLGTGKAVHTALSENHKNTTLCGGSRAAQGYQRTDAPVTCKKCLKILADREEAAKRTAYYAGLADQQDETLSQAPVDEMDDLHAEALAIDATVSEALGETPVPVPQAAVCQDCGHGPHDADRECKQRVDHSPNNWHLCLCLARPGADYRCAPQMDCQGGTLGYSDIWYLQRGVSLCGVDGRTITPDVLMQKPETGRFVVTNPPLTAHETDPRTGLPIVTIRGVRYVVGLWQRTSFGNVDYVDYWLASESVGSYMIRRAYADATTGTVARQVWDAQRALR